MRACAAVFLFAMPSLSATYATLTENQRLHGFQTRAVYLDASSRVMGARFTHTATGFTLDLLELPSVPQAFLWVSTPPASNRGEPHTQEHLLLSKGRKGRDLQAHETMSLIGSTAFTRQIHTCYPFHTTAGTQTFFDYLRLQLDAMLYPDYSDEEIRREVRHFGVTRNADQSVRLEEKGTIYAEMVSSMTQGSRLAYYERNRLVYGPEHPLAFNSGGSPEAIREMLPEHIRGFHRDTHHLANMGAVVFLPPADALDDTLPRFDSLLTSLQSGRPLRQPAPKLPPARPAAAGAIRLVDYPHGNSQQPGPISFSWPAVLGLDPSDELLFQMFLSNFAGDASTNLYKLFIDSRTRRLDLGARAVSASLSDELGAAAIISFPDAHPSNAAVPRLAAVREEILGELRRISAWPGDSAELAAFNTRMRSRLVDYRRSISKFVSDPPRFGFRGASSSWLDQVVYLERAGGFRRSLALSPELDAVAKTLDSPGNPWTRALSRWKLLDTVPFAVAARPSPELVAREGAEREARAAAETQRLQAAYKTPDPQQAIARYQSDYDTATAALDRLDAETKIPPFTSAPPMTADDTLDYGVSQVHKIPSVASRFPGMPGATVGLALRADFVPRRELVYLAALPALLTSSGVLRDGRAVSYEEMSEAWKNEILDLNASFRANQKDGRVEIVLRGSGNDLAEARRALDWMRLILHHPNWTPENLPRLRDVVDRSINALRNTMQRSEEQWVRDPPMAWWRQDPALLTASSFLTRAYHLHRLRWLLREPSEACDAFFDEAAALPAKAPRAQLSAALRALPACPASADAASDLEAFLPDLPDSLLAADWAALCRRMRDDLATPAAAVLESLHSVRRSLLLRSGARLFSISSPEHEAAILEAAAAVVQGLGDSPLPASPPRESPILDRYRGRVSRDASPRYLALAAPNMRGGVVMNMAPLTGYEDLDRESLLRYLAACVYAGGGAHGLFLKTWAAGLAYSNGPSAGLALGTFQYYAERTPEIPQTLRFVLNELRRAPRDLDLADYALSYSFRSNAGQTFEARGESIAHSLADGVPPEKVRRFRQALLDIRREPGLMAELYRRTLPVYSSVLPGLTPGAPPDPKAVFFAIGPEKQLSLYSEYLQSTVGVALDRLYPRDFWLEP